MNNNNKPLDFSATKLQQQQQQLLNALHTTGQNNPKTTLPPFSNNPFINGFYNFFTWCAGVDKAVLKQCSRNEWERYLGIGIAVFMVAVLAFVSGSFAIGRINAGGSSWITFFGGLIWAILIFNLDRLIVTSTKPLEKGWRIAFLNKELRLPAILCQVLNLNFLVRIGLTLIISLVITKPLEIYIFRNPINAQLLEQADKKAAERKQKLKQSEAEGIADLTKLEAKSQAILDSMLANEPPILPKLRTEREEVTKYFEKQINQVNTQIRYTEYARNQLGYTDENRSRRADLNRQIRQLINRRNAIEIDQDNKYNKTTEQIQTLEKEHNNKFLTKKELLDKEILEKKAEIKGFQEKSKNRTNQLQAIDDQPTLSQQIKALEDVREEDPYMELVSNFIMLLFIALELAPVLVKTLIPFGQYDRLLKAHAEKLSVQSENFNQVIEDKLALLQLEKKFREEEVHLLHEERKSSLKHQAELLRKLDEEVLKESEKQLRTQSYLSSREELLQAQEQKDAISLKAAVNLSRKDVEVENNKKIMKEISDAHLEIVRSQVKKWMQEQKKRLDL